MKHINLIESMIMIEIIKYLIDKLNTWQILIIIIIIVILIGAIIFFILINRIHIKLCGILEINSKKNINKNK